MLVAFQLSMPGKNSWNGKWTGEGKCYAIVRKMKKAPERISYGYNFGDGWYARVAAVEVSSETARKMRKQSAGFCGYDWMVDSIIRDGEIYGPTQPKPEAELVTEGGQ